MVGPEKISIDLRSFENFLLKRIKASRKDLEFLAKTFSSVLNLTEEEFLSHLRLCRREIVEKLGFEEGDIIAFITTFHLLPWEHYYYLLAQERISRSLESLNLKAFPYPVWYGDPKIEKPAYFNFFGTKLEIDGILNAFEGSKEKSAAKTTYEYYEYLKRRFCRLFNLDESEFTSKQKKKIIEIIYSDEFRTKVERVINYLKSTQIIKKQDFVFSLLDEEIFEATRKVLKRLFLLLFDFFEFFENRIKIREKIERFRAVCEYLVNNEKIKPILERLGITKENIDKNLGKMFFLVTILVGGVHIGAEWPEKEHRSGKLNKVREYLNLPKIVEFKEGVFAERFLFSEPPIDSMAFSLIFGDPTILTSVASLTGKMTGRFSPISEELRKSIRTYDFYIRLREYFNRTNVFGLKVKEDEIKEILKIYYDISFKEIDPTVRDGINSTIESVINNDMTLDEAISKFNDNIEPRYRIFKFVVKKILAIYLLRKYLEIKDTDEETKEETGLYSDFLRGTETVQTIERERSNDAFGGIEYPLKIPPVTFSQILEIMYLVG
jgi:hypothetical protein